MENSKNENSEEAAVKLEYIIKPQKRLVDENFVSEEDRNGLSMNIGGDEASKEVKKIKLDKKLSGMNKKRPRPQKTPFGRRLCPSLRSGECNPGHDVTSCKYIHDIEKYLEFKESDISKDCYMFTTYGHCSFGLTCRFGSAHLKDGKNIVNNQMPQLITFNNLSKDLQFQLRKKKYNFTVAEKMVGTVNKAREKTRMESTESVQEVITKIMVDDSDLGPLTAREIKQLDWRGKLYLAPLTTVGNLPFRRVCKSYGVDITCGEMALASSLLQGKPEEWALVRRHSCEDLFGVQLCGGNPGVMTRCAQMLQDNINMDFLDINMGCPLDPIYQSGSGSGLMTRRGPLETMCLAMSKVLTIPLTLKMRTGIQMNKNMAHILVERSKYWNVSMVTLHGRSREQRYTKSADWEYIKRCAELLHPIPLWGNGDILSFTDYYHCLENYGISGIMIGRGALIKPWIFTEIKEQRHWDISSGERLESLRKFVNYGLEHWGSDSEGVEKTRKFLLEWLSFLHRYIPVGLLERVPQKMNQRPPHYIGRNDLETLMASSACNDWIKISELLLGPVPNDFIFLPKHKANSWK